MKQKSIIGKSRKLMKRKIVNLLLGTMVTAALVMTGCGEKKAEETAAVTESSESATVATEEV